MSGRAKQRPPKNAKQIPAWGNEAAWRRLGLDKGATSASVDEWLAVGNGCPRWTVGDTPLYLSADGRTVYGESYLVKYDAELLPRIPSTPRSWDYQTTADDSDLRTRTFAYPIVRPLADYAPDLAERLGLPRHV